MNATKNIKEFFHNIYLNVSKTDEHWKIITCNEIISNNVYDHKNLEKYVSDKLILINTDDWSANTYMSLILLKFLEQFHLTHIIRTNKPNVFSNNHIFINCNKKKIDKSGINNYTYDVEETYGSQHTTLLSSVGVIWKHHGQQIIHKLLQRCNKKYKITINREIYQKLADHIYNNYLKIFDAYHTGLVRLTSSSRDQKVVENLNLIGSIISTIHNRSPSQWRTNNNKNWYANYKLLFNDFLDFSINILRKYSNEVVDYAHKKFNESLSKIPIDFSKTIPHELMNVIVLKEEIDIIEIINTHNSNMNYTRIIKILIYPNKFGEFIIKLIGLIKIPDNIGDRLDHIKIDEEKKIIRTNSLENALIISRCILTTM